MDINVTKPDLRDCLSLLKKADGFLTAADLAARMQLKGGRETRRRRVRAIIQALRQAGTWIVGQNPEGYFLTADKVLWTDYLEGRQIDAKRILGEAHRRRQTAGEFGGQGLLFAEAVKTALGAL